MEEKIIKFEDMQLSMPVIVGADGIESDIPINLSGEDDYRCESTDDYGNCTDDCKRLWRSGGGCKNSDIHHATQQLELQREGCYQ